MTEGEPIGLLVAITYTTPAALDFDALIDEYGYTDIIADELAVEMVAKRG